jgi:hypothetical protein
MQIHSMNKFYTLGIVLLLVLSAQGQNPGYETGARNAALGGATVAHVDLWSAHQNQGSMAFMEQSAIGVNYGRRFSLSELSQVGLAALWHSELGNFALTGHRDGFESFNRTKFGLAYGRLFGENIGIGVQFNLMNTYIEETENQPIGFTFELGFRYKISEEFSFAAHYFNPTRSRIHPDFDDRYSTILRAGFEFEPSSDFCLAGEAYQDMNQDIAFRLGIDYGIWEVIHIRTGFSTGNQQFGGGLGIVTGSLDIDLSAQLHRTLGWTPQIGLSYRLND